MQEHLAALEKIVDEIDQIFASCLEKSSKEELALAFIHHLRSTYKVFSEFKEKHINSESEKYLAIKHSICSASNLKMTIDQSPQLKFLSEESNRINNLLDKVFEIEGNFYRNIFLSIQKEISGSKNIDQNIKNQNPDPIEFNNNLFTQLAREIDYFNKKLEKNKADLIELHAPVNAASSKMREALTSAMSYIDIQKERIEKLIKLSSNTVLTGKYNQNSHREYVTANWLRYLALALMLVVAGFLIFSLLQFQLGRIDYKQFISTIIGSFTLSIPAIYLSRESEKHRKNHLLFLKKHLDLEAFDPFISDIKDKEKIDILKAEMAKKIFFQYEKNEYQNSYPDINQIAKIVKEELKKQNEKNI